MHSLRIKITLDRIICALIFLLPMVRYYRFPVLGQGFELILRCVILVLLCFLPRRLQNNGGEVKLKKASRWYLAFFLWLALVTIFYEVFTGINYRSPDANYSNMSLIFALLTGVLIYFLQIKQISFSGAIGVYNFYVYIILLIYLLQWALMLMGYRLSFKLPFEFSDSWYFLNRMDYFGMQSYPTAVFSERAHFCVFLAPYLALCLYSDSLVSRNRIQKAILCSLCMILTASGNGVIIVLVAWLLYLCVFGPLKKSKSGIFILIFGLLLILGVYLILLRVPRFSEMFNRLFVDNTGNAYSRSKADYRIYRGLDIFTRLPLLNKLSGVGYEHMYLFSLRHNIVSIYDVSWSSYEYFSAISQVLLYSGLIGFVLYMGYFIVLCRKSPKATKGLTILLVALSLSTEIMFNCEHIIYMMIIAMCALSEANKSPVKR